MSEHIEDLNRIQLLKALKEEQEALTRAKVTIARVEHFLDTIDDRDKGRWCRLQLKEALYGER